MTPAFTLTPPLTCLRITTCQLTPLSPKRRAERIAISRSIVIFADYLSDLAVLDAFSDITTSPHPTTSASLALLGAATGALAADLLTGLAALTVAHLPDGSFDIFGRPHNPRVVLRPPTVSRHPLSSSHSPTPVVTEIEIAPLVHVVAEKRDLFDRLVNSCFIATPALAIFTSWSAEATGDTDVFVEAFFVALLSLSALAPILRPGGRDCKLVAALRSYGILKRRDVGWCQLCGAWDFVLHWGFRRVGVLKRRPP